MYWCCELLPVATCFCVTDNLVLRTLLCFVNNLYIADGFGFVTNSGAAEDPSFVNLDVANDPGVVNSYGFIPSLFSRITMVLRMF